MHQKHIHNAATQGFNVKHSNGTGSRLTAICMQAATCNMKHATYFIGKEDSLHRGPDITALLEPSIISKLSRIVM